MVSSANYQYVEENNTPIAPLLKYPKVASMQYKKFLSQTQIKMQRQLSMLCLAVLFIYYGWLIH